MLLDMLAAIARKDYEDRRRRQAQGIAEAKNSVRADCKPVYRGRAENTGRDASIVKMRDPPGVPITMATLPPRVRMVGVMEERGRLKGAMALASEPTTPYMLGAPGLAEKTSISSFKRKPAPSTTTTSAP